LFDDYSRNYQDKNKLLSGTIINTKEKLFSCKVSFCIDNTIYYIEKEGKRLGAKTEHTFDTFKFTNYDFYKMESSNKVQLNGHDRLETLDKIKALIGEYSDFCISSVCLQSNQREKIDFFNMSPIEKKVFLNNRLKFDIFKNIESKYKDLLKETKINLKNIEKLDEYQNYNHNIDEQINDLELTIANYEQVKNQYEDELKLNNEQLNKLYKHLKDFENTFVKLFISNKTDTDMFDKMVDKFHNEINVHELNIIEDLSSDITSSVREDILEQGEDTSTFLNNYIDQIDTTLDRNKLKKFVKELYVEVNNNDN
jgi:hypothetical protein